MNKSLIRFARTALALMFSGAVATYQNDPRYLALSPLINALGKYLRERIGLKHIIF